MGRFRLQQTNFAPAWKYPKIFDVFRGGQWSKYASNPILEKGVSGWDSLGLRSPRLLVDINGYLATEVGNLIMYYSGFQSGSPHYGRGIGRATSADGISWSKYGSNPVLSAGAVGAWDGFGVQYPSVIKLGSGIYRMYYSGVNSAWTSWGVGIADSVDGFAWTRSGSNPVLTDADFNLAGNDILTFPYVIKAISGTWYMMLGGTYSTDKFAIFAASSADGLTWTALNSGDAVMSPVAGEMMFDSIDNIEGPVVIEVEAGKFVMFYHGNQDVSGGKHYIGIAVSTDMVNWSRYEANPILQPGTTGAWDAHRMEDAFIPKDDIGTEFLRMWFSAAPTSDGEDESAIGYALSDQRFC